MNLTITVDGDDASALGSLHGWLRRDRELAAQADIGTSYHQVSGAMGALDVVDVVLTHMTGLSTLVLAVTAWRQTRRQPARPTFVINGVEIIATDDAAETLAALQRAARAALNAEPPIPPIQGPPAQGPPAQAPAAPTADGPS